VSKAPDFTFWLGIEAEDQVELDLMPQSSLSCDDCCGPTSVRQSAAGVSDEKDAARYAGGT
jgi:hypothetical protein